MRRIPIVAIVILLAPAAFPSGARGCDHDQPAQQTVQNVLPNPDTFIAAGPACKARVAVSPWVGTPECAEPSTYRCVLSYQTCEGPKTVRSSKRPGGEGMCDDYWAVHVALANREICCARGSSKRK